MRDRLSSLLTALRRCPSFATRSSSEALWTEHAGFLLRNSRSQGPLPLEQKHLHSVCHSSAQLENWPAAGLASTGSAATASQVAARQRRDAHASPARTPTSAAKRKLQLLFDEEDGGDQPQQKGPQPSSPTGSAPAIAGGHALRNGMQHQMQAWVDARRKKLEALPHFPSAEIEDPFHEQVPFTGLRKQFLPNGLAWGHSLQQDPAMQTPVEDQKLLQVAVVGVPNAGKSSLVNALVGSKVAAVSSKTNTTTAAGLGAFIEGDSQVALFDTPGVVDARHVADADQRVRVRSAWSMAGMCDLILLIIDAHRQVMKPDPRVLSLVQELAAGPIPNWEPPPCLLVLNKVDKFAGGDHTYAAVTTLQEKLERMHTFEQVYPFSVHKGTGMEPLRTDLLSRASPGEWLLPSNDMVDMSPVKLCEEIVREKAFERLYRDVPYALRFERNAFRLTKSGDVLIKFNIIVRDRNVRSIVVGKHGAAIGEIGIRARREMEQLFQNRVHLFLDVVVRPQHAK